MIKFIEMDAVSLRSGIERGDFTAHEVAESAIRHIDAVDPKVQAFLLATPELAIRQADAIDAMRAAGETLPPLAGVTIALKDNLCTAGTRTTAGSRILHNFVPPYNATVVSRVAAAGALVVGKANLDEFAMGSSTENSGFHTTHNPWDLARVPGGSSGGSAAAVAACEAAVGLGSDTGGSIRQPASLCGVVGMKPTYGRVSRYGLIAYASSLDQIGPLSRTVRDSARLLTVIAGHDACDSTSARVPSPDYEAACGGSVKGLRIGIPKEFFGQGVQAEVADAVMKAVQTLVDQGATVEECSLPHTEYGLAAYYVLAPAECSSNLARFDGVKYGLRTKELAGHIGLTEKTRDEGFGAEVKQRIMIGTYALSAGYYDAYYKKAQQTRTLIRRDYDEAFKKFDILATPTSPIPAFKIGETADPLAMKLNDVCTLPVNMAGLPAISVPCGLVNGLPIGLQLIGKAFDEETIFRAAHAYEQATEWHKTSPTIA